MQKKHFSIVLVSLMMATISVNADMVADKNGIGVTNQDIDLLLKPAPEKSQLSLLQSKERFFEKLQQLYLFKAIAEQERNVPLTAEEQAELDKMTTTFHFQRKLKQLTNEDLPDFEQLAKLHYEANKADYMHPEQVAAEHILIGLENRSEKDALKVANDLLAQLNKGANFGELAEKYSDDPSAKANKGKLGLFSKGKMIKEFEDIAFSLKLHEISKPTLTSFGYHIIRVYEHKAATPKSYAEVKEGLIEKVKKEYIQHRLDEYYAKVKKDNEMKIDDKEVDAFIAEKSKQLEAKLHPAAAPVAEQAAPSAAALPEPAAK